MAQNIARKINAAKAQDAFHYAHTAAYGESLGGFTVGQQVFSDKPATRSDFRRAAYRTAIEAGIVCKLPKTLEACKALVLEIHDQCHEQGISAIGGEYYSSMHPNDLTPRQASKLSELNVLELVLKLESTEPPPDSKVRVHVGGNTDVEARIEYDRQLSLGVDRGNYANAYETEDYDTAIACLSPNRSSAYVTAFTLGFFSSYEIYEMAEHADTFREALTSAAGKRCIELGYVDADRLNEDTSDDSDEYINYGDPFRESDREDFHSDG